MIVADDSTFFHNRITDFRVGRGWSQRDLAREAGLTFAEVCAIEGGATVPSTVAALLIAAALGCEVGELFRLEEG
ncbi:helix-turn-helix transcriptional regulator [Geomesophilobacter sediminis]|uniref:Helix-turn-helix transcriptional regulator n=1 Tax=Geomesophilobacter sediminis TaxID=2798584 RepID=A0A8J7JDB5_9BACT|nr:helix-turn-helix transcriptional regulator [Geomesophilobacter sediminis]MBJ6725063.1 helix-turn-helix transcriptional regulator [Geomesophilobacter sediminis]